MMRPDEDRIDRKPIEDLTPYLRGIEYFYALRIAHIWRYFRSETFAFWMICGYFFVEYIRPQSIIPQLDVIPWGNTFVLLAFTGWLLEKKNKWTSHPISVWVIIFFISIMWSTAFATYPRISLDNLANIYTWIVVYFLIINIVNSRRRFYVFLFIFLLASAKLSFSLTRVWAFRGFSFTTWGLKGPPGFFENSGELAIQMAVFAPIALAVAHAISPFLTKWKKYFMYAMPITAALVILGASSRGAQLALLVQVAATLPKKIFRLKYLAALVMALSVFWVMLPDEQKVRFSRMGEDKTSIQRMLYWKHGIAMLNDHPLTGVGFFNFSPYYAEHYSDDLLFPVAQLPHNIFVQVGAELGYPGLFVYAVLLLLGYRSGLQIRRMSFYNGAVEDRFAQNLGPAMNVSLLGFIVAGQFVSVVYYPFMWIHLALVVSLNSILLRETNARKVQNGGCKGDAKH